MEKQANGHAPGRRVARVLVGDEVEPTLERWTLADPENSPAVTRQASIHLTVWGQMNLWLDNVALAFPDEALPLREWLPILEAGLANLTVGVVPPALDQVLIGAIDRARNPDLKLALVLGVNESVFPAAPAVPAILTDADRDEIETTCARARSRFAGTSGARALSRLHRLYPRERKTCRDFLRHDADGRTLNPSPFIAHLRRILPGLDSEESGGEINLAEAEHVSEIAPFVGGNSQERG